MRVLLCMISLAWALGCGIKSSPKPPIAPAPAPQTTTSSAATGAR